VGVLGSPPGTCSLDTLSSLPLFPFLLFFWCFGPPFEKHVACWKTKNYPLELGSHPTSLNKIPLSIPDCSLEIPFSLSPLHSILVFSPLPPPPHQTLCFYLVAWYLSFVTTSGFLNGILDGALACIGRMEQSVSTKADSSGVDSTYDGTAKRKRHWARSFLSCFFRSYVHGGKRRKGNG
jgi:hypothetical protein